MYALKNRTLHPSNPVSVDARGLRFKTGSDPAPENPANPHVVVLRQRPLIIPLIPTIFLSMTTPPAHLIFRFLTGIALPPRPVIRPLVCLPCFSFHAQLYCICIYRQAITVIV